MAIDKSLLTGSTTMLLLKLLEEKRYVWLYDDRRIVKKSDDTFSLKAGTLYPLLHAMEEKKGLVTSYEANSESGRQKKILQYYQKRKRTSQREKQEWKQYSSAVDKVLKGGATFAY